MIDRVDNLSSYSLDILQKLFKKSMVSFKRTYILKSTDPEVDYLREKQKGVVTEDHREKLFSWIFNVLVFVNLILFTGLRCSESHTLHKGAGMMLH